MSNRPVKRHFVNIRRTSQQLDDRGQPTDATTTVASDVNCSIESLSGRELENARQIVADASKRVTMWADPTWELRSKDWLEFGQRKINIGHIADPKEQQNEYILLCSEDA